MSTITKESAQMIFRQEVARKSLKLNREEQLKAWRMMLASLQTSDKITFQQMTDWWNEF